MKAYFDEDWGLVIEPETEAEDKRLHEWYKKHSRDITRKVIFFKRFKQPKPEGEKE